MYALQELSLSFPQPSSFPGQKLLWLSKPDDIGAHLSGAAPPGWGAQCGAQTPRSSGETTMAVISLPLWVRAPGV